MSGVFFSIQALLTLFLIAVVVERCRALLFVAPASRTFVSALAESLESGAHAQAQRLARALPRCWASRLLLACVQGHPAEQLEQTETTLADLRLEAGARLTMLRVSATISSTLGLLGGILAIRRGFSGEGLLSLSAGLAQQVALNQALSHMAVGMGTAAFSFTAFALFRGAARDLLAQVAYTATRCRGVVLAGASA